ncbi:hypothetical protein [Nocardiopsis sp. CC223A]|uniref:hypothetical protein n=1 Tax=Nocardiopsis sp. CC223A TaxID=3044051 RepID=UPI00278C8DF3|nr:hypothetical protein [Nocardiopsis sp. CC223A]
MSSTPVGVNVNDAQSDGEASADAAARLKDLPLDFDDAITAAKNAVENNAPGVAGWGAFGDVQAQHMIDVQTHAHSIAENAQDGAGAAAGTDEESASEFRIPINDLQLM